MAIYKLCLAIAFLLQLSFSTMATRQPTYGVANSQNGGSVCGTTPEGGTIRLSCTGGQFTQITFASFGNPQGSCGSFTKGTCEAPNSLAVVQKACLGKQSCFINASQAQFGPTPCPGVKVLAVEATC